MIAVEVEPKRCRLLDRPPSRTMTAGVDGRANGRKGKGKKKGKVNEEPKGGQSPPIFCGSGFRPARSSL